jgi:hypothetical protein
MTFYEAALRVLEGEGRPLHFVEITERSIAQSLLSHVGKMPEQTMLARLAAMARRKGERRVMVTAKDTFALVEWALAEDAEALAQTGLPEPHPEEGLPPMRPEERHPEPRGENVRASGRGAERGKRRRDEDEERGGKKKRFPPVPEVVFEALSERDEAQTPASVLERLRESNLVSAELTVEAMLTGLLEDNQKRIDAGRRPQFVYARETGQLSLERAGAPSEAPSLELQAAFASALGIPLEGGRPVLGKPAPGAVPDAAADEVLMEAARGAVKDARKATVRALRRRLSDLDVGIFERAAVKMLHGQGFRELKVAKRGKEGPLVTARRREGSVELRFAIRMHKGGASVDRRMVQDLRKDLGHYSAQVGLLLSPGDLRGDARTEAQASGALVMLWCGEALAEKFAEAHAGVTPVQLELLALDEAFFAQMGVEAEDARKRREERQREREGREEPRPAERTAPAGAAPAGRRAAAPAPDAEDEQVAVAPTEQAPVAVPAPRAEPVPGVRAAAAGDEDDEEGEDEDDLAAAAAFVGEGGAGAEGAEGGAAGDRRRRRRRRRGRRGRGAKPEGEGGAKPEGEAGAKPEGEGGAKPEGEAGAKPEGAPEAGVSTEAGAAVAPAAGGEPSVTSTAEAVGDARGEAVAPAVPAPPEAGEGSVVPTGSEALPATPDVLTGSAPQQGSAEAVPSAEEATSEERVPAPEEGTSSEATDAPRSGGSGTPPGSEG